MHRFPSFIKILHIYNDKFLNWYSPIAAAAPEEEKPAEGTEGQPPTEGVPEAEGEKPVEGQLPAEGEAAEDQAPPAEGQPPGEGQPPAEGQPAEGEVKPEGEEQPPEEEQQPGGKVKIALLDIELMVNGHDKIQDKYFGYFHKDNTFIMISNSHSISI